MRYLLWGTAAALVAATTPTSASDGGWYVGLEVGMSDTGAGGGYTVVTPPPVFILETTFGDIDESITLLGTIGAHLTDDVRFEVEVARRSGESWDSEVGQTTLMFNVAYDIPVLDQLAISVGGGIGANFLTMDTPVADADGVGYAYQAMIGLSYEVTKSTDITLTYRHFDTIDGELSESTAAGSARLASPDDQTLSLGVRFGF